MKLLLSLFLLSCGALNAATLYCGPSSTGSGTGADFNNLVAFSGGGARGNTYKLIEGSYGSITLGTAASGTTRIVVEYVTSADSGVAGYSSTLHDGQAVFGTVTVNDPYYTFDGKTRTESETWDGPDGYGFRVTNINCDSTSGDDGDFFIGRYLDIGSAYEVNPSSGTINSYGVPIRFVYGQTDITFTRCAIHNGKGTLYQGASSDRVTFEYCDFGPGWGKEAIRGGNGGPTDDIIVRYCRFWESTQIDPNDGTSGITAEIGIWDWSGATATGIQIYGNWFYNSKSGTRNACIVVGGNGGGWAGDGADGTLVYNNTFVGMPESGVFGMIDLNGSSTEARNNLFYDTAGTGVGAATVSNNVDAGSDPFVSYSTWNLRLSDATTAGATLSSPYDTDADGVTRGGDGTWDVGAFEFVEDAPAPPPPNTPRTARFKGLKGISGGAVSMIPHNHPASALLFETFEGTGFLTAGWTAVTGGGGTVDPDFTSTILDGSQSLEINGPTDEVAYATNSFSAQAEVYGYFIFKITSSSPVEDSWISLMRFRDADGATVFKLQTDGNFLRITTGGQSATALTTISLNTTYYCWVSWSKNTGSNSEATLAFSTTKVQPTSGDATAAVTNGSTVANDASQIFLGYANDTVDDSGPEMTILYDYVLVDDVAIPDYP